MSVKFVSKPFKLPGLASLYHTVRLANTTTFNTMNKLYLFGLIFILAILTACKKERTCPPAIDGGDCELFENRIYPKFDISSDPDAWYEADIEGNLSTVGTGYEGEGFMYYGDMVTHFRTSDPDLPPGTP